MPDERKPHRRDRYDAWYIPGLDPMHVVMPYMLPQRTDNEAVLTETFDLTALNRYLEKKNAENTDGFKYTFFHVIVAAINKTIQLRPKMNWFISGRRYYERKTISNAFVVKRELNDRAEEALAIIKYDPTAEQSPVEQIHGKVRDFVHTVRVENVQDGATDFMSVLEKLPRPIIALFAFVLNRLEYHGHFPKSLAEVNPYHATVFLSNLGSIKMNANYHHLANFGNNSFFVCIGEKKKVPKFNDDGSYELHEALDMSFTIDERIADGTYFAKSLRYIRKFIAEPELLERPATDLMEDIEL